MNSTIAGRELPVNPAEFDACLPNDDVVGDSSNGAQAVSLTEVLAYRLRRFGEERVNQGAWWVVR